MKNYFQLFASFVGVLIIFGYVVLQTLPTIEGKYFPISKYLTIEGYEVKTEYSYIIWGDWKVERPGCKNVSLAIYRVNNGIRVPVNYSFTNTKKYKEEYNAKWGLHVNVAENEIHQLEAVGTYECHVLWNTIETKKIEMDIKQ